MPIDFPTVKYADPTTFPPASPASTDAVMARTSGGADKSFVLGNLAGLAPLVVTADQSAYYTGSAWAAYTVTSVGRTLLAATTQPAQRAALGAADDTAVVHIAGTETITGAKTFSGALTATGNVVSGNNFTTTTAAIALGPGTSGSLFLRPAGIGSTTGQWSYSPTVTRINCDVTPATDNAFNVGAASLRPIQYYAVNSTINTSDARAKTEPRQLRQEEVAAFAQIARLPAIWRWLSRVNGDGCEPEGREARKHGGPTVQAAMAIMEAHGLAPMEYACFCHDEWEAQPEQWHEWAEELDEDGEVIREAGRELVQEAVEAGDRYSFRKEELLCLIVAAMAAQHDALEARVAALEAGRTP